MIRRRDKRRTRISSYSSERLESRRVLSGYFNDVDQALTQGPGAALNQISTALHTLGPISNRLPLLNKPVRDVTQITDSLVGLTNELHKVLPGLDPGSTATLVRTQIYNQLSSLAIVGDRNGNGVSDVDDIAVTIDTNGVDLAMNLTKSVTFNSAFGIGLDSVPFRASGNVAASMTVTLSYDNLHLDSGTVPSTSIPAIRTNCDSRLTASYHQARFRVHLRRASDS